MFNINCVVFSFYKKGVLKILQNSQETPCASVSFLIKLQLKNRLYQSCFPVNFAQFLRTLLGAATGKIRAKFLKFAKFQFRLFLSTLNVMGFFYIVTK